MSDLHASSVPDLREKYFVSFNSEGQGVSSFFDDVWDFTAQGETLRLCSFKSIPQEHKDNIKRYLYAMIVHARGKHNAEHISVSRIIYWRDCLCYLLRSWGNSEFSLLSNDYEWRKIKLSLKGKYSIRTLKSIMSTINGLSETGLVSRYIINSEIQPLAINKQGQQYIALPSTMHALVLEQVTRTIDKYYEYRHEISNVMSNYLELYDVMMNKRELKKSSVKGAFNRAIKTQVHHKIPDFRFTAITGEWVKSIVMHCLIAVGLFSGARRNELLSFQRDSYAIINGVPVLKGTTFKGNQGVPITTTWVTHPLAEKALTLAYDVTEYSRKIYKKGLQKAFSNGLLSKDEYERSLKEINSVFITTDMRRFFNGKLGTSYILHPKELGNYFDISATPDEVTEFDTLNPSWVGEMDVGGGLPAFSLHSLRRSFAVFMVRNRLGNTQAIKYQYKHQSISMSGWYANHAELARMENVLLDEELLGMVKEVNIDIAIDAFDDIYNQSETLSGGGGERVANEKEYALKRGEKVVMNRSEIGRLVRNNSLSIVLLPTGAYCTNADCERLCSIESFVAETRECEHQVITYKGAKIMAKQRERLVKAFLDMNAMGDQAYSRILVGYKQKILLIEQTLEKHNINFEPFTGKVEAQS